MKSDLHLASTLHRYVPEQPVLDQLEFLRQSIDRRRSCVDQSQSTNPFVTLSYAQSIDGSIALRRGEPLILSGSDSLWVTHTLRAMHDAILVGINTVLADNPRLTVRLVEGPSPTPVVLDSHLRIPPSSAMFQIHKRVIVATVDTGEIARPVTSMAASAEVLALEQTSSGQVSLSHLLSTLSHMGIRSIMVEGGALVLNAFLAQRLADYGVVTIAPVFVGGLSVVESPVCASGVADHGHIVATNGENRPLFPTISDPAYTQVGRDLVLWGSFQPPGS